LPYSIYTIELIKKYRFNPIFLSIISNQISSLLKSEIFRNTGMLVSGTVFAQLIPLLLQPVLRRFFEPEVFGAFAIYQNVLAIIIVGASLRFEQAVVMPKSDKWAANLVFLSIMLNLAVSVVLALFLSSFVVQVSEFLNQSLQYSLYIYLLPFGIFLYSTYQVFHYWLIRQKAFKELSYNKLTRRLFEGSTQILFMFTKNTHGLFYGDIIGNFSNLIIIIRKSIKNGLTFSYFEWKTIKTVFKEYIQFPKYNLLPAFLASATYFLPTIIIGKLYGQETAAFFDLAKMLLVIPVAFIGSALSGVLLQRYSNKYREKESILRELLFLLFLSAVIAVFEIIFIQIWGISVFRLFFGENWIFSGELSHILVWAYAANFLVSSFTIIFVALNKVKLYSFLQLLYFVGIAFLFFLRIPDFEVFIKIYVGIEIFCTFLLLISILKIVWDYDKSIILKTSL